eukprot:TRINITY_DN24572_c0_g1_i1.p1 TRINITY_DN24572_c0_g1~~TRINITY_DN24572_c0_g1_i1.p1  ORF type:complete len:230 (+),score=66.40 TRINITY_DN24572_c0_g1_i1:86-691(+)
MALGENKWRLDVLREVYGSEVDAAAEWAAPYRTGEVPAEQLAKRGYAAEVYGEQCRRNRCRPNSGVLGALQAAACADIAELSFDANYLGSVGLLPLLAVLPLLPSLQRLSFRSCGLDAPQVTVLARVAARLPSLRSLDVADNPFGCLGGKALLEAAEANRGIVNICVDKVSLVTGLRRKLAEQIQANCRAPGRAEKAPSAP